MIKVFENGIYSISSVKVESDTHLRAKEVLGYQEYPTGSEGPGQPKLQEIISWSTCAHGGVGHHQRQTGRV